MRISAAINVSEYSDADVNTISQRVYDVISEYSSDDTIVRIAHDSTLRMLDVEINTSDNVVEIDVINDDITDALADDKIVSPLMIVTRVSLI